VIVGAFSLALLAASLPLIAWLRTLNADRAASRTTAATVMGATATRVTYSVLVVIAFAVLPLAWALGLIPTGALAALLAAPLAMRLGDIVSHRSGEALAEALREGAALVVLFALLFLGGSLLPI
jgi:1,4-dihydroxy-2-naphthoate octaprenyltransferase